MKESKNIQVTQGDTTQYSLDGINSLVNDLNNKNKLIREKAQHSLISIGEPVTGNLVKALSDPRDRVRWEIVKILDEIHVDWTKHADEETINILIGDLNNKDGRVRVRARNALVSIGGKSVFALTEALKSKEQWTRWEAAKALSEIGDSEAMEALLNALHDEVFEIRWLAGEGLIAIGRRTIVPLLKQLIKNPDSLWLQEGAHRILHGLIRDNNKEILKPVLNALEGEEIALEVPFIAETALKALV